MSISKIRESAREALTGKWGKGVSIILAYLVIGFVIGLVERLFDKNSVISSLLGIATAIIEVPISLGLAYAFIKLKRGEEIKAFEFLNLGFSNFGRAWKIALRTLLKLILHEIGFIIVNVVGMLIIAESSEWFLSPRTGYLGLYAVGIVLYIGSYIWMAVVCLLYSLTSYVAYDNPNMTSLEVVNESAKMMNGNRWKLFLLELSFIGWAILGIFTLGIGYLWLVPYIQVALVCFYEHLLGKNEGNDNNDDNNNVITEL